MGDSVSGSLLSFIVHLSGSVILGKVKRSGLLVGASFAYFCGSLCIDDFDDGWLFFCKIGLSGSLILENVERIGLLMVVLIDFGMG